MEAAPLPDQEASTVAQAVIDFFVSRFGVPLIIHSDQGRQFESRLFKGMCKTLGMTKTRTTTYHPQSNGMVERFNRTLGQMLHASASRQPTTWDLNLQLVLMAYRSTAHESTGYSPNTMMLGREVALPTHLTLGASPRVSKRPVTWVAALEEELATIHEDARELSGKELLRQKKKYNVLSFHREYSVGEKVFLHTAVRKSGESSKLRDRWLGPFTVKVVLSDVTYCIEDQNRNGQVVHHDRLKPFEPRESDDTSSESEDSEEGPDSRPCLYPCINQPSDPDPEITHPAPYVTERGRTTRQPTRYSDYVLQ